jgi:hypothetical protein
MKSPYGESQIFYDDFITSGLFNLEMLHKLVDGAKQDAGINPNGASMDIIGDSETSLARIIIDMSVEPPVFTLEYAGSVIVGFVSDIENDFKQI